LGVLDCGVVDERGEIGGAHRKAVVPDDVQAGGLECRLVQATLGDTVGLVVEEHGHLLLLVVSVANTLATAVACSASSRQGPRSRSSRGRSNDAPKILDALLKDGRARLDHTEI